MIYHKGIFNNGGKVVVFDDDWGFNAVVTPRKLPPPAVESAVNLHLRDGALLVSVVEDPPLFDADSLLARLSQMKSFDAQDNQCLLALVGRGGDEERELYNAPLREWMAAGGIGYAAQDMDSLYHALNKFPQATRKEYNLVDWLALLPGLNRGRAKDMVDSYGAGVIELFTTCTEDGQVTILKQEEFEGLSLAELQRLRSFFELPDKRELRLFEVTDEEEKHRRLTREFEQLAKELGGKVRVGEIDE